MSTVIISDARRKKIIATKGSSWGTFHSPTFKIVLLGKELSINDGIESTNQQKRMV
jgi:hypothetical protein